MVAENMTPWERIRAAIAGEPVDRAPISLWRYFPDADQTAEGLAAATVAWQRRYHFDLVKVTPPGTFTIEDWGAETTYADNEIGGRTVIRYGVTAPEQWPTLASLDVSAGMLGQQLEALRLLAAELDDSVPILQTVQSPFTTAHKLAGDRALEDVRRNPALLTEGLAIIADTNRRFAAEALRVGAHGIFFATHGASHQLLSRDEHDVFGERFDRQVLEAVRADAEIIVVHAHGQEPMFDVIAGYPTDGVNWHDRAAGPSLAEARERFDGLLVGGVSEWETLLHGPPSAVRDEVRDAVAQTEGRGLLIGPGCVLPVTVPDNHLRAARVAVVDD